MATPLGSIREILAAELARIETGTELAGMEKHAAVSALNRAMPRKTESLPVWFDRNREWLVKLGKGTNKSLLKKICEAGGMEYDPDTE